MKNNYDEKRFVIISNRLPLLAKRGKGGLELMPGSGGLVSALAPVLRNRGGVWIGWPGIVDVDEKEIADLFATAQAAAGFSLRPVPLSSEEVRLYYDGFANEIIWPLFHELSSDCVFDPSYWEGVQGVTKKFAQVAKTECRPNDFLWIHDYHLLLLGRELRRNSVQTKSAFFLHIPFPAPDIFLKLPWRFEVLRALLEYDLIGFQTMHDQRNFTQCVRKLLPDIQFKSTEGLHICKYESREVRIGSFPISIDYNEFSASACGKEVADEAWVSHEKLAGQKIIFSLDRLDSTKGIPYRLEAIRDLLINHPELHRTVTFVQVIIPSRTEVPKYQALKKQIDQLIGEINGQFTQPGWVPIHYIYRSLSKKELLAFYRMSEVALVTSVRDGMNLVSKEYIAANVDERGVLVLSEFAGAASQLQKEALLINPFDIQGVSRTIYTALTLPDEERKRRMRRMRHIVRRRDIFWWVRLFLQAAISKELHDFPIVEEYTPSEQMSDKAHEVRPQPLIPENS